MPTKLPDDFEVTDQLREWSLKKYGFEQIPDYIVSDFRRHHAAKGTKHDDWYKALQNWIIWASPGGQYHNALYWETVLERCKRANYKEPVPEVIKEKIIESNVKYTEAQKKSREQHLKELAALKRRLLTNSR